MRILQVEDQPLWREAMARLLTQRFADARFLSAATLDEALRVIAGETPTLVLTDYSTAEANGAGGIEAIVQSAMTAPVLVLDARLSTPRMNRSATAGAKGYIPKTASAALIEAAIGVVIAGGLYFPQTRLDRADVAASAEWILTLSERQRDVLDLVLQGKNNREIAEALDIALPTAKFHIRNILGAAGVRSRTELALSTLRSQLA